jgi:hypothetical protein
MDLSEDADDHIAHPPSRFQYKGTSPWTAPPVVEADATFFHADTVTNVSPKFRHFVGTINLGFAIIEYKRSETNVAILIKQCVAFAKQIDPYFRIEPLSGNGQCISNPSNIPTSKEGMDL